MSNIQYKTRDTDCIVDVIAIAKHFADITKARLNEADPFNRARAIKIIDKTLQNFVSTHREIRLCSGLSSENNGYIAQFLTETLTTISQIARAEYSDITLSEETVNITFVLRRDDIASCIIGIFDERGTMSIAQEICGEPIMTKQYVLTPFDCSRSINVQSTTDDKVKLPIMCSAMFFDGEELNAYLKDKDIWKIKKEEEK